MARVVEETITIKISQLVKNDVEVASHANTLIDADLEGIVQELVGDKAIVEIVSE